MDCGDQRHLGLCLGYVPALAYGSCSVSDQGTTLRASDLHNARATILNPFNHTCIQMLFVGFPEGCYFGGRLYNDNNDNDNDEHENDNDNNNDDNNNGDNNKNNDNNSNDNNDDDNAAAADDDDDLR